MCEEEDLSAYLDGVQQTKHMLSGVVEVILPLVDGLQAVHHTTIVTVRRRSDQQENNPAIEGDDPNRKLSEGPNQA